MTPARKALASAILALACAASHAGVLLEPTPAPEWKISEWINGNPGTLSSNRDKLILINFFQMWCPGSDEFSLPLFEQWQQETFADRDDVLVLSIHTVFEGHAEQTPERLKQYLADRGITHPVGVDQHPAGGALVPVTMDRFETGGTPHVVIVDKEGDILFSHFGRFEPETVERFVTRMLDEDKKLNLKSTPRDELRAKKKSSRKSGRRQERQPTPPQEQPVVEPDLDPALEPPDPNAEAAGEKQDPDAEKEEKEEEDPSIPDPMLSGSYKLRFEQRSKSCGDIAPPIEVITQLTVYSDRIVAKFSRPYLGIRELTASYDESGSVFQADSQGAAQNRQKTKVELNLQMNGRFLSIDDPPELEFDYFLDQATQDGSDDCIIEGTGAGSRFRAR